MRIVCFGDSNTYGYDPRDYFGGRYDAENRWVDLLAKQLDQPTINLGMNGREIPRTGIALPEEAEKLIIMLGTNDVLQGADADTVIARMAHFLDQIKLPHTNILLIAPPPLQRGAWVDSEELIEASIRLSAGYQRLAAERNIPFTDAAVWHVPLAFDGVHFTGEGHRIFAQQLALLLI